MTAKEEIKTIVFLVFVFLLAVAVFLLPAIVGMAEEQPAPAIHSPVLETASPLLIPAIPEPFTAPEQMTGEWENAEASARLTLLGLKEKESRQINEAEAVPAWHRCDGVRLTAYCPCEICCGAWAQARPVDERGNEVVYTSTGALAVQGVTVAVDPEFIPHGAYVYVQDPVSGAWREYRATDTSPAYNHVDVYFSDHAAALGSGYGGYGTVYWSAEPVDVEVLG